MENFIKYIPNTDFRYSISENGKVLCHYKYNNKGEKFYKLKEVSQHFNISTSKSKSVSLQIGKYSKENKMKTISILTLMEICFNLKPPDKYHLYDLSIDENIKNGNLLDKLVYIIRTNKDSNYKFYPSPTYSKNGKIIKKICADCGEEKKISFFVLQNPKKEWQNKTYRNICEPCRSKRQIESYKNDELRIEMRKIVQNKWNKSENGKMYHKEYINKYYLINKQKITKRYIAKSLKLRIGDLNKKIITISKKRILLTRKIQENEN
jgi:hypothetical protein